MTRQLEVTMRFTADVGGPESATFTEHDLADVVRFHVNLSKLNAVEVDLSAFTMLTAEEVRLHNVALTGAQLRVLREVLAAVMNGPEWAEFTGPRDWQVLARATDVIVGAHVDACRAESTPAGGL